MTKKCPSCGGTMKKEQQGDDVFDSPKQEWLECEKCGHTESCGGSGEVDVEKAEREAVAAGYKKVSLPEKPSEADEDFKEFKHNYGDRAVKGCSNCCTWELCGKHSGLFYVDKMLLCSKCIKVLRGLLEKKEEKKNG
jgi:hypothetical protein